MIFPWMFDELKALRPFKEAANILAEKVDWPSLYDKKILANNKVSKMLSTLHCTLEFSAH